MNVDARTVGPSVEDVVRDSDDRAVHGRVHVRARYGTDVEHCALAATQLVVDEAAAAAAEDLVREPRECAFVALAAERAQRQRAVAGRVIADRGDAALCDGELNA